MPIQCHSSANPSKSDANPVPAKWQSIANAVPFMCQSISDPMPILDQYGPPSPIRHSYEPTKESTNRCQSLTNLPIHHKSLNNPIQILVRSPILDQHMPILDRSVTSPPIRYKSWTNKTIRFKFANPISILSQYANLLPIHQSVANPH